MSILLNFCTPYYDNQYQAFTTTSGVVATNVAIQHPNAFYTGSNWAPNNSLDFWNYGNNAISVNNAPVNKTIYSPSPTGFSEPETAAFTGFITGTGIYTTNSSEFNVNGKFNKGWNFYCQPKFKGSTVFFSALGYRVNTTSALIYVSGEGDYWTAGPSNTDTHAHDFGFISSGVYTQVEYYRAYGFSVRPVSE